MLIASLVLAATVSPAPVLKHYEAHESKKLVPMLSEVIQFPTHQFDPEAHAAQKAWLMKTATDLGFVARDAGKITEIELPDRVAGDAPVLGLVIHGDVQPADAEAWSFYPFSGGVANGYVLGRGSADDKGPLIQALMAMKALAASRIETHAHHPPLVGSEEESAAGRDRRIPQGPSAARLLARARLRVPRRRRREGLGRSGHRDHAAARARARNSSSSPSMPASGRASFPSAPK